ncbi:hypothetical protein KSB_76780 [Ktedonobacter robiniae]|uniref:NB-ARC domain-containing protein n=2 Tax=Ktedonobacter robiniae TaxID=2778365 RepID=A0ABQ3V2M1_9CHLR|nr:hypothetical protein KSB_76780 [Ktedonobacter robiniae]
MALRSAIGFRKMLIILDDVWNIEDIIRLKVGGPNCAYLLTSRFLHIASSFTVNSLLTVPELNEEDGLTLLKALVPSLDMLVPLDDQARCLVRAIGSLPLALTFMGRYLRTQGVSGQARRLEAAFHHLSDVYERLHLSGSVELTSGDIDQMPCSPSSLYSKIMMSDALLSEGMRRDFYALSIFPSKPASFSEEEALTNAQCSLETLDFLTDIGLIESGGSGRYMLHPTIADYIRVRLEETTAQKAS